MYCRLHAPDVTHYIKFACPEGIVHFAFGSFSRPACVRRWLSKRLHFFVQPWSQYQSQPELDLRRVAVKGRGLTRSAASIVKTLPCSSAVYPGMATGSGGSLCWNCA